MKPSKPAFFIVAAISATGACAQPNEACFAFLLRGDVTAVCNGKTSQITRRGDIESFAVSEERSSLAYTTSQTTKRDAVSAVVAYTAAVVNLKTGTSKHVEGVARVVSTCGGILGEQVGPRTVSRDLVTDEDLNFSPYTFFRCSVERRVVAGFRNGDKKDQSRDLYEGFPPATKIAAVSDASTFIRNFNVSPDGSKVAWFGDVRPLCLLSGTGPAQCVDHATMDDPVSVRNSGEVLVADGTGKGCAYKNSYDFSPPRRGETDNDECLGIGYWKPGLKSIEFLEPVGRNPQWLGAPTVDLLRKWSAQNTQKPITAPRRNPPN
jgi:hypothetical protein